MVTIIKQGSSKASIKQSLEKLQGSKGLNAKKYFGVIRLKDNPLSIQKKLRDEWA